MGHSWKEHQWDVAGEQGSAHLISFMRPLSMTHTQSSMVMLVSATFVATTILRTLGWHPLKHSGLLIWRQGAVQRQYAQ